MSLDSIKKALEEARFDICEGCAPSDCYACKRLSNAIADLKKYRERLESEELLEEVTKVICRVDASPTDRGFDTEMNLFGHIFKQQAQAAINIIKGE